MDLTGQRFHPHWLPEIFPYPGNGLNNLAALRPRCAQMPEIFSVRTQEQEIMEFPQHHGAADRYLLRLAEEFHETEKHFHDVFIGIGYGEAGVRLFFLPT